MNNKNDEKTQQEREENEQLTRMQQTASKEKSDNFSRL